MEFDTLHYLRFVASLSLVLGLILAVLWAARRFTPLGAMTARAGSKRLAVVESQVIDARRRLVLVRRDGHEHLLLVGGGNDVVIETAIGAPAPALARAEAS